MKNRIMRYSDKCFADCSELNLNYEDSCDFCKIEYEEYVITERENKYREMTEDWGK